jgi:putative FmdB family regulatory protein
MPTYTYGCKACGHEFDVFHSITATPKLKCESCGSTKVERHLGTGAGIIFKGGGFYETDFKDKKGKPDTGGGESAATSTPKPEAKKETKPAAKPAAKSKPAAKK